MPQPIALRPEQLEPDEEQARQHLPDLFRIDEVVLSHLQASGASPNPTPRGDEHRSAARDEATQIIRATTQVFDVAVCPDTQPQGEPERRGTITAVLKNADVIASYCVAPLTHALIAKDTECRLREIQQDVHRIHNTTTKLTEKRNAYAQKLDALEDIESPEAVRLREQIAHNDTRLAEKAGILSRREHELEHTHSSLTRGDRLHTSTNTTVRDSVNELIKILEQPRSAAYHAYSEDAARRRDRRKARARVTYSLGFVAAGAALVTAICIAWNVLPLSAPTVTVDSTSTLASPFASLVEQCLSGNATACGDVERQLSTFGESDLDFACERRLLFACNELATRAMRRADFSRARSVWTTGCDEGNAVSCHNLAIMFESGQGVPKDPSMALRYFGRACEAGDGFNCIKASSAEQRKDDKIRWSRRGCDLGSGVACSNLGTILVNTNHSEAVDLFEKACDMGEDIGCYNAAYEYRQRSEMDKAASFEARMKNGPKHFSSSFGPTGARATVSLHSVAK